MGEREGILGGGVVPAVMGDVEDYDFLKGEGGGR